MTAPIHDLHVSNLVTYLSLCSGIAAMAAAIDARSLPLAGAALAVSAIADTFDGRFARRFQRSARQTRLGHELDSLVDAVVFGVAPIVVVVSGISGGTPRALGWMAGAFYLLAALTRLAFYNVQDSGDRFVGLPSPAAALLCVSSLVVGAPPWLAAWPLVLGGVLMTAPFEFPRPRGAALAAFVCWGVALITTLTWQLG